MVKRPVTKQRIAKPKSRSWNISYEMLKARKNSAKRKKPAVNKRQVKGPILKAIRPDGSLYSDRTECNWYLTWDQDCETATLDGRFTPTDLRAIADYMDAHFRPQHGHRVSVKQ